MKTNNGIELNLNESDFIFEYKGAVFYFSSELYRNKFKENLKNYIEYETAKIYNKFKTKIDIELYLCVSLYRKIEKRGFRINYNNISINENTQFTINMIT